MTARSYLLAYSAWLASGGSPDATAGDVVRWWRS